MPPPQVQGAGWLPGPRPCSGKSRPRPTTDGSRSSSFGPSCPVGRLRGALASPKAPRARHDRATAQGWRGGSLRGSPPPPRPPPPTPGRLSSGRSLDCQSRAPPPHSGTRGVSSEGGARRCDQSRGAGTPTRAEPASDWSSTQKREQGARLPRASLPGAGACRAERAGEDRAAGARAAVRAGIARGAGQCAGGEGVRGQVGEASVRACETGAGAPPGALWPGGAG